VKQDRKGRQKEPTKEIDAQLGAIIACQGVLKEIKNKTTKRLSN